MYSRGVTYLCGAKGAHIRNAFVVFVLLLSYPIWADSICGDPPPVANEALRGEIEGQAHLLSRLIGDVALSGAIETKKEEIFSKYPDAERSRSNAYFEYQICVLIMNDNNLSNVQKIEELKKVRREFGSMEEGVCVPTLAVPANNAVLPQRRLDNERVEANWMFGWRACPEASKYHLFVIGPGALNPIVNLDSITSATFQHRDSYYHGVTRNEGWTWKVRAYVDGQWGAWS